MSKRTSIQKAVVISDRADDNRRYPTTTIQSMLRKSTTLELLPYGYSASAPAGSASTIFEILGEADHLHSISYEPDSRFKNLNPGEVQIGNQVSQSSIKFENSGDIVTVTKGNKTITVDGDMNVTVSGNVTINVTGNVVVNSPDVTINSSQATINGNLRVQGSITDNYNVNTKTMSDMRAAYNVHKHLSNGAGNLTDTTNTPV